MSMEFLQAGQEKRALEEDVLLAFVIDKFKDAVFHGGTCIWRCYNGKRYSKDLDFYINIEPSEKNIIKIRDIFKDSGFVLKQLVFNRESKTLVIVEREEAEGRIDFTFSERESDLNADYERVDGTHVSVKALSADSLLLEKTDTYLDKYAGKRPEIQDLYDIYHLASIVNNPAKDTVAHVKSLIDSVKSPPRNERQLPNYMLKGERAPNYMELIGGITRWYYASNK